jgi:drug/metabolite transporter (DMT)-like permease
MVRRMVRSYMLLLFCVTVWGSNVVFGAILVQEFPPMLLAVARLLVTTAVYACIGFSARYLPKPTLQDLRLLVPIGLLGTVINQTSFYIGLQYADPTTSALLLSLSPVMIGFLAAVFLRERITARMAAGSVAAIIGVFAVVGKGGTLQLNVGELLMIAAMLSFSVSTVLVRKLILRRDPFFVTAYSTMIGTAALLPISLGLEPVSDMFGAAPWAWALLIGTALVMQVLCGLIWNRQMQIVGASQAAVFLNMQPFVAMVLGYLLLGHAVTLQQGIGAVLIVGGVVWATSRSRKSKAESRPVPAKPGSAGNTVAE